MIFVSIYQKKKIINYLEKNNDNIRNPFYLAGQSLSGTDNNDEFLSCKAIDNGAIPWCKNYISASGVGIFQFSEI